ncbi:MAG: hypothetical protein ACK452_04270 [Bacteroidota bacterium]
MSTVHIGKKIKEVLSKSPMTVVDFAEKINKTRTVVYDIFKRDSIDSILLNKISRILNHNLFQYYPSEKLREEKITFQTKDEIFQQLSQELKLAQKELQELKKRNELLEKLVSLLEKKDTGKNKKK